MKRLLVLVLLAFAATAMPASAAGGPPIIIPPLPAPIVNAIGPVTSPVCGTAEMYLDLLPVLVKGLPPLVLSLIFGLPFEACGAISPVAPSSSPTTTPTPPKASPATTPSPIPATAPATTPAGVPIPSGATAESAPTPTGTAVTFPTSTTVPGSLAAPVTTKAVVILGGRYGFVWAVPLALLALGWLVGTAATRDLTQKGRP
jgi:hypothetical protein